MRIVGASLLGGAIAGVVSLAVGFTLLELPFSLPFSVVLFVLLSFLGILLVLSMTHNLRSRPGSKDCCGDIFSFKACSSGRSCALLVEVVFLVLVAVLTVAGGIFSLVIYFHASGVSASARIFMFLVLGASVTVLLSVNLLDLCELTLRCCYETKKKHGGLSIATPISRKHLFPMRAQSWLILMVAFISGIYYGWIYGNVAKKLLSQTPPGTPINVWPSVVSYLDVSLPVALVGGFATVALALMLPHVCSTDSAPASSKKKSKKGDSQSESLESAPLMEDD